jgi:HEAT repeat protein
MNRITQLAVVAGASLAIVMLAGCQEQQPSPVFLADGPMLPPVDMGKLETQALRVVVDGLADPDPRVRANAIEVVALTRYVLLMPKVQRLLQDPALPVRFLAILAVGDLEYALAQSDIVPLLDDSDANIRIVAAYAMTRLGHPEYFKVFRDAIASEDQTVRANAALLLGKSGRKEGLRFLYWALRAEDSEDKVVLQAAESIAMMRDRRIYPKLWTRLISAYADDRMVGIRGMGALATEEAKNALVTMLDDPVLEVRLAAAAQLGKLGEPVGAEEVRDVFKTNALADRDAQGQQRVKVLTALAIGEIASEPLDKYLPRLLADPSKPVRLAAAKAILQYADKKR